MEAVAKLRNIPTSPRKMRLVVDMIRGQKVDKALSILKFEPRVGASKVSKLLLSAIANWEVKNPETPIDSVQLYVKSVWVDGGKVLKRLQPAPQGRAHRVRKRSNHVTIIVDAIPEDQALMKTAESVENLVNQIDTKE
jgi:large subunit ribosomal protein L22